MIKNNIYAIQVGSQKIATHSKNTLEEYALIEKNLQKLSKQLEDINADKKISQQLLQQLQTTRNAYQAVLAKQEQINENLAKMNVAKNEITQIFSQVYDYKLLQYMMKLELFEKDFLLQHTFDEEEFSKEHFKMRRSVRGSEHFTEDKQMQKKINDALLLYKQMLFNVVSLTKEIGVDENQGLKKELQINQEKMTKDTEILITQVNEIIVNKKQSMIYLILIVALLIVVGEYFLTYWISSQIDKNLKKVQNGLKDFFDFIGQKTNSVELIEINTKDEFKLMADNINENIEKNIFLLNHNREVLEEANDVL